MKRRPNPMIAGLIVGMLLGYAILAVIWLIKEFT